MAYITSDEWWVAISASASDMAFRLFKAIGREAMIEDPRYSTPAKRLENGDEVDGIVADWIRTYPLTEVLQVFEDHGVPIAPIYDIGQIVEDPQYLDRETIIALEDEK